jgi:hypothetical protein
MSVVRLKNLPVLKLSDLLRKRRKTLKQFIDELGISNYEALCARCQRIGVAPPTAEDFDKVIVKTTHTTHVIVEPVVTEPSPVEPPSKEEKVIFDFKKNKKKVDNSAHVFDEIENVVLHEEVLSEIKFENYEEDVIT